MRELGLDQNPKQILSRSVTSALPVSLPPPRSTVSSSLLTDHPLRAAGRRSAAAFYPYALHHHIFLFTSFVFFLSVRQKLERPPFCPRGPNDSFQQDVVNRTNSSRSSKESDGQRPTVRTLASSFVLTPTCLDTSLWRWDQRSLRRRTSSSIEDSMRGTNLRETRCCLWNVL